MAARAKTAPEEVLKTAQYYWYLGFAFLPWLWLTNFLYLYPLCRRRQDLDPRVLRIAYASLAGALVWVVVLAIWIPVFVTQRASWGSLGDVLAINIPYGT
ncbi:hypothetical protein CXG81DRAFT_14005 [Caulochytrium protostelioides]|uniref:Gamma-secretase subunit PEN-2 n=1 Tax=Caulochytrium protostelioides TaxID=1555241 RepID=A0A4P9X432_9FUNG|nr:hypothetical protein CAUPRSCDRAFT_8638 [Caulochytrium protostelioides]RKO99802.1 hypothetical protein CXG81DRAFT_14005 [Caulochytrium protostelioides]|eukprot:RKO99802.1 hypothetical protein CXG81DRAFT_14005 [Caulochytrium protostelioides]